MNISLFYHSLVSDWNNGNAHFLRGIVTELKALGHRVKVCEPADGWSFQNLRKDSKREPISDFQRCYPNLQDVYYRYPNDFDPAPILEESDLVVVHEWNDPELILRIGRHRKKNHSYRLLFHDTHHRAFSQPQSLDALCLENFDGILVYGESIRRIYLEKGWNRKVWTWHEAADARVFRPVQDRQRNGELVWIGNWGDDERTTEYIEFLLEPVQALRLKARAYGVRYPREGLNLLKMAGMEYCGWLANYKVPQVYAQFAVTLHIPRRPYAERLPGIPTIRPFEALACGIPLVSAPWKDVEGIFSPGEDFLMARNGREMKEHLSLLINDKKIRRKLVENGRRTILNRHTCAHRVQELMSICGELGIGSKPIPSEDRYPEDFEIIERRAITGGS